MSEKTWGGEPFWGLGYEWDPDWVYTDRQKELRATLIELCEQGSFVAFDRVGHTNIQRDEVRAAATAAAVAAAAG